MIKIFNSLFLIYKLYKILIFTLFDFFIFFFQAFNQAKKFFINLFKVFFLIMLLS